VDQKLKKMIPRKRYADNILFQIDGSLSRNPMVETERTGDLTVVAI
jgi:hypothetical protein